MRIVQMVRGTWLLLSFLLAGCWGGVNQPPTVQQPMVVYTPTALPIPLQLTRSNTGFRIDAHSGGMEPRWLDASHMLVEWTPDVNKRGDSMYLADLSTLELRKLPVGGVDTVVPRSDGQKAILKLDETPLRVALLDVASAQVETVFAADPGISQWAGIADCGFAINVKPTNIDVTWIAKELIVLKIMPGKKGDYRSPGKLLLVQLESRKVQVLAEEGELAAVLPDGSLVMRPGWIDGPLQVLTPPYDGVPTEMAPGGPSTEVWSVSPNGEWVAWFEMEMPGELGPRYLPQLPGSWTPEAKSIAFWNRASGQVRHYPVNDVQWPFIHLHWRKDNSGVVFTAGDWKHVSLTQIAPTGQTSVLAQYSNEGVIWTYAETDDGSLYYFAGGRPFVTSNFESFKDQVSAQLVRRLPDGQLNVLHKKGGRIFYLEEREQLVINEGGGTLTFIDLGVDRVRQMTFGVPPVNVQLSPDGGLVVYGSYGGSVYIDPIN